MERVPVEEMKIEIVKMAEESKEHRSKTRKTIHGINERPGQNTKIRGKMKL